MRATDPVADAEEKLRGHIHVTHGRCLEEMGLEPGADKNHLTFSTNLKESLEALILFRKRPRASRSSSSSSSKTFLMLLAPMSSLRVVLRAFLFSKFQTEAITRHVSCLGILSTHRTSSPLVEVVGGKLTSAGTQSHVLSNSMLRSARSRFA